MKSFEPIAVVGRACLLPGANSPAELWEAVAAGRDLVTSVPNGRWGLAADDAICANPDDCADRTWSDRGGYIDGFDALFDPSGFGVPEDEVRSLDPVFQWTFHTAREALRDAGYSGADMGSTGAVFGNLSFPSAGMAALTQATLVNGVAGFDKEIDTAGLEPRDRFMSGLPALMLERALGLGTGATALDAACASSLYAIKLACDRLHDGDADLMLAGAVNCADILCIHLGFAALKALSRTGRSRPFHEDADGLVPAEGCAFVALRRLSDAVRDGDTIHGVIRGVGLSNDGRGRAMLVPSSAGQERAISQAFEMSELSPNDVSLIECHATGTQVGDGTEIESSAAVYGPCSDLPIGSLKSNLGHLITAAGVAGLIKVMEAMAHEIRPRTLHVDKPHPSMAGSPFRLLQDNEPWDRVATSDGVLRAGVSAFGFGGNNAHLIVEEPGEPAKLATLDPPAGDRAGDEPIAIVGLGIAAAGASDRAAFARALRTTTPELDLDGMGSMGHIELAMRRQKFPPNDLAKTLPQQLAMLQVTDEALADAGEVPRATTGVYVGMGTDPEAARFGLRWRIATLGRQWGASDEWISDARDLIGPVLDAPAVLGSMPNIVANRLNSQFDLAGPSFAVSSEERSGLDAVTLAARALRHGEIDAALVGAVDMCCDPVHRSVAATVLGSDRQIPGDAAVMLVLKRLSDAERDGDKVYAIVSAGHNSAGSQSPNGASDASSGPDRADLRLGFGPHSDNLTLLFGHSHAASSLVHIAAAALCLHERVRPGGAPLLASNPGSGSGLGVGLGPRTAEVVVDAMDGLGSRSVYLAEASGHRAACSGQSRRVHVFSGSSPTDVVEALDTHRESTSGSDPARLVIVAADDEQFARRAQRARRHIIEGQPPGEGVHYRAAPVVGEMAFVFTAAGVAYGGAGAELVRAMPELVDAVSSVFPLGEASGWLFSAEPTDPSPDDFLWGTALVSQAHACLTRDLLGLKPTAAIGYSSGESNSLFAFGVWSDMAAMRQDIDSCQMMTSQLGGSFNAIARAWGVDQASWAVWNALAPVDDVRLAVTAEPRVHLAIINTHDDVVIAGDAEACQRVVSVIGQTRCVKVDYNLACHVPEVAAAFHDDWVDVHTRRVEAVPEVRFYSNGANGAYKVTTEACASVITAQAEATIDFPATIEAAYADGVRIFVEHGPAGACTNFINKILAGREFVAVQLDRKGRGLDQVFDAAAALLAAGVDVDIEALIERLSEPEAGAGNAPADSAGADHVLRFPAHREPVRLPPLGGQTMDPAPTLPPVRLPDAAGPHRVDASTVIDLDLREVEASPTEADRTPEVVPAALAESSHGVGVAATMERHMASTLAIHESFVDQQIAIHEQFLNVRASAFGGVASAAAIVDLPASHALLGPDVDDRSGQDRATLNPTGPSWSRAELKIHSSGKISELFGPIFEPQDHYAIQCRMPEPPLLLADRVVGLDAEAGVLGTGTIWTETDIAADSWYLNDGFMPAGFMIESGQADLLLISYMGIDLLNRGERAYRLLGCTLTYHGDLPTAGDTLEYEIRITGHANLGDIRLFFFEYDCIVNGERRLTVRDGQAGFFSGNELAEALGVLWSPTDGVGDLDADARVDGPAVACTKSSFSRADLVAFGQGRVRDCFGPGYEWTHTHTRTPKIQSGDRLFIDEVTEFDVVGGLWGRGFMRCETTIDPDSWFFEGHFKNDPCMPGNFMVEACIQALSFYLTALGHTTRRDGWRFQPLTDQPFDLKCRGEINPQTQHVAYEIYVEEVWDGPHPTVIADVVGFVDGKPAFHAHRLGVELVPSWPLTSMPELVATSTVDSVVVAVDGDGFEFDWKAMLSCAWGKPSEAFGSMYEVFDGVRRSPRLPGPPYHFISRVVSIDGEVGQCQAGMEIVCEYDIPADAWYFDQNGTEVMPFAVLLEAALQPCGWVASAVGSAVEVDDDLLFRNLDGTGTVLSELTRTSGVLTTKVKLTSVSRAGGMIIEGFEVECWLGDRPVYEMTTVFGFFPPEAFEDQVGLKVDTAHEAQLDRGSVDLVDLTVRPGRFCDGTLRLAGPMLLMLDRAAVMPDGGEAGLGVVVGEKDVDITEWFFKAHFFGDPVQPGSLGIEALLQLLQFYLIDSGVADAFESPRFEPISIGSPLTWKYRGQVTPKNRLITSVMEITEVGADEAGPFVVGKGSLWCDGLRIYEVEDMAMRVVNGAPTADAESLPTSESTILVDASTHPHLVDHSIGGHDSAPVAVVPVAYAIEWFARAAEDHSASFHQAMRVVELTDIRVLSGVSISDFANGGGTELKLSAHTTEVSADGVRVDLRLVSSETGRPHYSCSALLGEAGFEELQGVEGLRLDSDAEHIADPYAEDVLFHGPRFQVLGAGVELAESGARARVGGVLDRGWSEEPWQTDVAMFDGALQLALLSTNFVLGGPSLPTSIRSIKFSAAPLPGLADAALVVESSTATKVISDVSLSRHGLVVAELIGIETHKLTRHRL